MGGHGYTLGITPGTQRITAADVGVFLIRLSRRFIVLLSPPTLSFSLDQTVPTLGLLFFLLSPYLPF